MDILKVAATGLIVACLLVYLRQHQGELAVPISLMMGVIVFLLIREELAAVVYQLAELASRAGLNNLYLETVLKVIGISYLVGFAAGACRDAGEKVVGEQVEFAGKVLILFVAVPVMLAVLESILDLLP
ncbi:MAG: stage III sporulation protein AD [Firmicutes bacterium]|nr:stage III sporulation protein AD [Bacillota bacterium]